MYVHLACATWYRFTSDTVQRREMAIQVTALMHAIVRRTYGTPDVLLSEVADALRHVGGRRSQGQTVRR